MGIKQNVFAEEMGEEWTQKKVSVLESKEKIGEEVLAEVSRVLGIPEEAIRNFDQDTAVSFIANTFHDNSSQVNTYNYDCNVNPIVKVFEMMDELRLVYAENKALHAEKEALYERLLKSEKKG